MSEPYRSASLPRCPRCGDPLEEARPGHRCTRCAGVFVSERVLARVLDGVRHRMWWRDAALLCPVCGAPMQAVLAGEEVVDRCPDGEGLWFDDGELARLLAGPAGELDDVLAEVRRRLDAPG